MATDQNAFKAGLFILASVGLGAGILVAIRGTGSWFEPMRDVRAAFTLDQNLGGLKAGDPARVGGLDQGRVKSIDFIPGVQGKPPHFEVHFSLPEKYDLRTDAVVQVEQGLTGTADLNISDFGKGEKWQNAAPLAGKPSQFSALLALGSEGGGLIADLRGKIGPAYEKYANIADRAGDFLGQAKAAVAKVDTAVGDTRDRIAPTLDNLKVASATLRERLPDSIDRANRLLNEASDTLGDVRHAMKDVQAAATNTKDATAEARSLLIRNHTKVDNIVDSLRNTSINLEGTSEEVRRSPWRLLYQPNKDELNNLNLYDSARLFARAAGELNDAAGAVRDAARDPAVDQKQLQAVLSDLQRTFAKYREVEDTLWRDVKE
ncbi:MAG: MlaD family protein [Tepidisphaeraceae bacterium]